MQSGPAIKATQAAYVFHYNCHADTTTFCGCRKKKQLNPVLLDRQNKLIDLEVVPLCYAKFGDDVLTNVKDTRHFPMNEREKFHDDCNRFQHVGKVFHAVATAASTAAAVTS
eukprot:GEMP01056536.1.p1 GENE.GEMP01056536.1~~GEMP01056536.1.p1  ORF type:complete len:112 (+),score=6.14 GEMP01056536.1:565-900(+)